MKKSIKPSTHATVSTQPEVTSDETESVSITASAPAPSATASNLTSLFIASPPSSANIPSVPPNFDPGVVVDVRGFGPKSAELRSLPLAVTDLAKFTGFAQIMGSTVPPYAQVMQLFEVTNEWSSMRTASKNWDVYSQAQESICWRSMRLLQESLKSAFQLAVKNDPTLGTQFAGLATFLGAKQVIAKKGASTRRANRKAVAEGKPPVHGAVGKTRQKQQNKAIVAAADAAAGATGGSGGSTVVPPPTTGSAAPVASGAGTGTATAPVLVTAPVSNGVAAAQVSNTNGVGH